MCLALQILNFASLSAITQCIIYSDSQAALQATMKPAQQSGQEVIKEFLGNGDQLQTQRKISISLIWIPGHMCHKPVSGSGPYVRPNPQNGVYKADLAVHSSLAFNKFIHSSQKPFASTAARSRHPVLT